MVDEGRMSCYHINNLPNFRVVCSRAGAKDDSQPSGLLYRSSRPDLLTERDMEDFKRLGIRAVVDFRSVAEYQKASGEKLIDTEYSLCQVKTPHVINYKPDDIVKYKRIDGKRKKTVHEGSSGCDISRNGNVKREDSCATSSKLCNHYLINFFTGHFIWTVFNRASWYIKLYSSLVLFLSFIFRCGYVYFFRIFATRIINPAGLAQQYKDMIDLSQRSICAALKLLSDRDNIPALINCAHGKDRTGIVTALVMYCLGKSREEIIQEYGRSADGLKPVYERICQEMAHLHLGESFIIVEESTMIQLLDHISEKYGSVGNYLECIGFGPNEQIELRRNLLCSDL